MKRNRVFSYSRKPLYFMGLSVGFCLKKSLSSFYKKLEEKQRRQAFAEARLPVVGIVDSMQASRLVIC